MIATCSVRAGGSQIGRTTEKELNVVLSVGFGEITVERGSSEKIFVASRSDDNGGPQNVVVDYSIRNRTGFLEVELGEEKKAEGEKRRGVHLDIGGDWKMKFCDAIPISFDLQLGVAKGVIDLSGLSVKDLNLSCGASDVVVMFNEPNSVPMNELTIECGVSRFEARNLGNANFKRFKFQGGVGAATLDFGGAMQEENVEADVEVGLGVCTIIVPYDVGAKVLYEDSFASRISLAKDIHGSNENEYLSDNFKNARSRIVLNVSAGFGSIKIKRK
jgi:hypothetical protein